MLPILLYDGDVYVLGFANLLLVTSRPANDS